MLFTPRRAVKPPGANALQSFESTCASERGLGDCAHARDVVRARASMTCVARALFVFHIHAHTTHTQHNNTLSTQLFFHEISLKISGRNIQITRTNQQHLGVRSPNLVLCLVLLCTFAYVRMYVPVCSLWSGLFPVSLVMRWSVIWCQDGCLTAFAQGALPEEYLSRNFDEQCLGRH